MFFSFISYFYYFLFLRPLFFLRMWNSARILFVLDVPRCPALLFGMLLLTSAFGLPCGCTAAARWGLVAVVVGGGCSNRAAHDRWGRGRVAHVGVGLPSLCAQAPVSLGDVVPMLPLPSLPPDLPGRFVAGVRRLGRSTLFHRPWDYVVKKGLGCGSRVRSPTPRQSRLIAAWKLDVAADGHRLLLCNLSRAESIMRRHLASVGGSLNDAVSSTWISVELRDSYLFVDGVLSWGCVPHHHHRRPPQLGLGCGWRAFRDRSGDGCFHGSLLPRWVQSSKVCFW